MVVFPTLKTMRYCDSNVSAMDKIFYLVKRVDAAINKPSSILNDEELLGSHATFVITGCDEELHKVFGESGFCNERYELFSFLSA